MKQSKPSSTPLAFPRKTDRFALSGRAVFRGQGFVRWLLVLAALSFSCSGDKELAAESEPDDVTGDDSDASDDDTPSDDDTQDDDAAPAAATVQELLGNGDAERVTFRELFRAPADLFCPGAGGSCPGLGVDLEFNPARPGELWAVFRQPYAGEPCNTPPRGEPVAPECSLLQSMVAIFRDATVAQPEVELQIDGNAWHFMRVATALAFADDDTFATVGEARTGNFLDEDLDYMGPTWWSSDPAIFAQDFNRNGSHLDMLHASPFGMGIAHQSAAVFWVFNGQIGSLDRYDFHEPHVPGAEDHSDGEYARYVTGELQRLEGVPSHMAFHSDGTTLYVADSGNQRVVALDTTSGAAPVPIQTQDSQIAAPVEVMGAELSVVVPPGVMVLPSGLTVYDDHLIVTDAQTSRIHLFDASGEELLSLDTGFEEGTLAGITVGPDKKVYLVDWPSARVLRLDAE
jgi:hypothetical protein